MSVISLKPSALEDAMQRASVVTFHAPWCGHCKRLMPVMEQTAAEHQDVPFFKINASKYGSELRAGGKYSEVMQKVRGFPTIVMFDGKGGHRVHSGPRTGSAIVAAFKSLVGGSSDTAEDLTAAQVSAIQNGIVMFHWTKCGHCLRFMPAFREFQRWASDNMPHLTVGTVEGTLPENQSLSKSHGVRGYPTVRVFRNGDATTYDGKRSFEALQSRARELFSETMAEEEFMSEAMEESIRDLSAGSSVVRQQKHSVTSIKASAVEDVLRQPAAVLMAHAPWCGYCARFMPTFEELSTRFPNVKFARINWDKYGNDVNPSLGVSGFVKTFPTIIVVRDGNVFKFKGNRSDLPARLSSWFS